MKISEFKTKMINWVAYNGNLKPDDSISDGRWHAMVAHITREYLSPSL